MNQNECSAGCFAAEKAGVAEKKVPGFDFSRLWVRNRAGALIGFGLGSPPQDAAAAVLDWRAGPEGNDCAFIAAAPLDSAELRVRRVNRTSGGSPRFAGADFWLVDPTPIFVRVAVIRPKPRTSPVQVNFGFGEERKF